MTLETKLELKFEDGRKVGYSQGHAHGLQQGMHNSIIEFLSDIETVPDGLKDKILAIEDLKVLQQLNKLAARVGSLEEFQEIMER